MAVCRGVSSSGTGLSDRGVGSVVTWAGLDTAGDSGEAALELDGDIERMLGGELKGEEAVELGDSFWAVGVWTPGVALGALNSAGLPEPFPTLVAGDCMLATDFLVGMVAWKTDAVNLGDERPLGSRVGDGLAGEESGTSQMSE